MKRSVRRLWYGLLNMEIITNRFLPREFTEEDEPAFLAYHADPRYAEFCGPEEVEPDHTRELLRLFIQWAGKQPRRNYQLAFSIPELEGNASNWANNCAFAVWR